MKQKLIGLSATAVIGSALFATAAEAENVTVKSGDTIWSLSQRYETSPNKIMTINGLNTDLLKVGQVLEIPTKEIKTSPGSDLDKSSIQTISQAQHQVKAGESLWIIAKTYKTTVTELKNINRLKSDIIYVGQKLNVNRVVSAPATAPSNSASNTKQGSDSSDNRSTSTTYKVQSGDTLWKIANQFNLTIGEIKLANNLKTDVLKVGQIIKISSDLEIESKDTVESATKNDNSALTKIELMINEAKLLKGTPYRWGGNTPSGFDCSGFIYYVLNKVTSVSRLSTAGYWDIMKSVSTPAVGDFVFFTTYKAGPSHMGIYLGNNEFIHASSSGVSVSSMNNAYWKQRYLGAKRFN